MIRVWPGLGLAIAIEAIASHGKQGHSASCPESLPQQPASLPGSLHPGQCLVRLLRQKITYSVNGLPHVGGVKQCCSGRHCVSAADGKKHLPCRCSLAFAEPSHSSSPSEQVSEE